MRQDGVTGKIGQQEWLKPAEEGLTKSDSQSLPDQRRPTGEEFSSWNMDRAPPSRHSHRRSDWRLDSDYCLRRAGLDSARRVGLVHGLLNVASVILFGSSLVARRKGARTTGRSLAALGYAVSVRCRSARRQSGLRAEDRSRPHRCRKAAGGVHTGARGIACGRWQASEG